MRTESLCSVPHCNHREGRREVQKFVEISASSSTFKEPTHPTLFDEIRTDMRCISTVQSALKREIVIRFPTLVATESTVKMFYCRGDSLPLRLHYFTECVTFQNLFLRRCFGGGGGCLWSVGAPYVCTSSVQTADIWINPNFTKHEFPNLQFC